jgi:hypothetical protein
MTTMPFTRKILSKDRVDFASSLTRHEISSLVDDPHLKILQTCDAVEPATWEMINDLLFAARPDVELRVYGFYSSECDLSFLKQLTNLRHFSADCLMRAKGVEYTAELAALQSLSIGIHSLENFDFLSGLAHSGLRKLSLGATKSKKPRLRALERFSELRKLYLEGQEKEIEVISRLPCLEDLTLRSITVNDLGFLCNLSRLWSLDIKLGGINNLSALSGMGGIKYLELWQIRSLADISVISTMHGLQYLFLQSLPHITTIPDLSKLRGLRRMYLENMKGLKDITALAKAPALEELMHCDAKGMEPKQYADLLTSKCLKRIFVGFGSNRKNQELLDQARAVGIQQFERSQFSFT